MDALEWFDKESIHSGRGAMDPLVSCGTRAQAENRHSLAWTLLLPPDLAGSLQPIHPVHLQVHENQTEPSLRPRIHGSGTVTHDEDCIPHRFEASSGDLLSHELVFRHQHTLRLRFTQLPGPRSFAANAHRCDWRLSDAR
jgi:hypothetical protein